MRWPALVKQLQDEKTWKLSSGFFQKEYTMNAFLANMKKPVVAVMHGTTRESRRFRVPIARDSS